MINYNIWDNKNLNNAVISKQSIKWLNSLGQSVFTVGPNLYKVEIIKGVTFYSVTPSSPGEESIQNALKDNIWKKASYDNPTTNNSHRERFCFFELNLKEVDLISFKYKSKGANQVMAIHFQDNADGQITVKLPDAQNEIECKDLIKQNMKTDLVRVRFYNAQDQTVTLTQSMYIEVQKKWSSKIQSKTFTILDEFKKSNLTTVS